MSKSIKKLPKPEYWLRQYIFNELKQYDSADVGVISNQTTNPIIPAAFALDSAEFISIVEALQSEFAQQDVYPLIIRWDKLMRFRTAPFYRIKKDQLILEIMHPDVDVLLNATAIIEQLLDREDASGQDITNFSQTVATEENPLNVFFHRSKVFKVDESRDLIELNSVNLTFARNKVIIEYDYHAKDLLLQGETTQDPSYQ